MMDQIDETHDPHLRSWVPGADTRGCDFPIQNLPFGVFRAAGSRRAGRVGVAIGDYILEVAGAAPLLEAEAARAARACASSSLNQLMTLGRSASRALRRGLSGLLSDRATRGELERFLTPMAAAELMLPACIGDYTDFYASVHHATNVGALFRPDNPLLPNYKWVPIAYHGRASSVVVSGAPVVRPSGQTLPLGATTPSFGPSRSLDYEMELGVYIGAPGRQGSAIPIDQADSHIFGVCLLNDWSARDIQAWEYQPLGPFLSKNFATTVSPWVITAEALSPFRAAATPRPQGDPAPLPYLTSGDDQAAGALNIVLEACVSTKKMRAAGTAPAAVSRANATDLYWTLAQMVAHHASSGCGLEAGDLLGSGTVSGANRKSAGCLLEVTRRGAEPIGLPDGETRAFLEDGDEVILRGRCEREGFVPIGLGECRGRIAPALG